MFIYEYVALALFSVALTEGYLQDETDYFHYTNITAHPYYVRVRVNNKMCSGVIISHSAVLTTAECFNATTKEQQGNNAKNQERWSVLAGATNFIDMSKTVEIPMREVYVNRTAAISGIISHTEGIAIVILAEEFIFSSTIQAIKLPKFAPMMGVTDTVLGWDPVERSPRNRTTTNMYGIRAIVSDPTTCKSYYIRDYEICLLFLEKNWLFSYSDGPLVNSGIIYGFVPINTGIATAAKEGKPLIDVHYYRDWIISLISVAGRPPYNVYSSYNKKI